jgi:hypothetical protein
MKLIRSTLVALAVAGLAAVAQAQTSTGGAGGGGETCACGTTFDGGPIGFCFIGDFCSNLVACGGDGSCPAGTTCVVGTCCPEPGPPGPNVCATACPNQGVDPPCANPEQCGTYTLICEPTGGGEVPTVSEWGLIVMTGLLLAAGGFVIWRRRSAPAAA